MAISGALHIEVIAKTNGRSDAVRSIVALLSEFERCQVSRRVCQREVCVLYNLEDLVHEQISLEL